MANSDFTKSFDPANKEHVLWLRRFSDPAEPDVKAVLDAAPWPARWRFDSDGGDLMYQAFSKASMSHAYFLAAMISTAWTPASETRELARPLSWGKHHHLSRAGSS